MIDKPKYQLTIIQYGDGVDMFFVLKGYLFHDNGSGKYDLDRDGGTQTFKSITQLADWLKSNYK